MSTVSVTLEDKILVQGALAGETEYFSVLVDRHATVVRRCIESLVRNPSDVEDLVQDTFMKAWLHLSAFRFEASFRTWLLSVALNEGLALHRRRRSRPCCISAANVDALPSESESPHEAFTRWETRMEIYSAVTKLPMKYRQVLVLCDLQQLTMRETANRLETKVTLVKTRLFRARRMLSKALSEDAVRRRWSSTRNGRSVHDAAGTLV